MKTDLAKNIVRSKKATLMHEWTVADEHYRLISVADATKGYEDEYVVEKLTVDSLGEPSWRHHWMARARDLEMATPNVTHLLIRAIRGFVRSE